MYKFIVAIVIFAGSLQGIFAQQTNRTGIPYAQTYSSNRAFPCAGTTIYEETFDQLQVGEIPQGWAVLDADNNAPNINIANYIQKGWQRILDFKDSSNIAMASPSWYTVADSSDDWLMTKKVSIGNNTCLSWYGYSQDIYYPEKYEVRISTTTQDTAAFLVDSALYVVKNEFYSQNYRSVNLSAYKNKDVYIAFRQKSFDKFILVLDNVRFSNVLQNDPAMFGIINTPYADTAKTIKLRGALINYGSDTLFIDSAKVTIAYQINNGDIESIFNKKKWTIAPNDTLNWAHDSLWITPKVYGVNTIKAWFSGIPNQPLSNDTTTLSFYLYPTNIAQPIPADAIKMYPNPAQHQLFVEVKDESLSGTLSLEVFDLMGRSVLAPVILSSDVTTLTLENLSKGLYFVRVTDEKQRSWSQKLMINE